MEKLYTFKELKEMKKATLQAGAKMILSEAIPKKKYTAGELSAMTGGLLSVSCVASRGTYRWRIQGKLLECTGSEYVSGGRKLLAELDAKGNIIKTFYATLPGRRVNFYQIR